MTDSKRFPAVVVLLATSLLAGGAISARAEIPDYILLKRCTATMDEVFPSQGGSWQIGVPFVSIRLADGRGAWTARHSFEFDTYAFCNGANERPEYGTGDDVCLGRAGDLPGSLVYSAPTQAPDALSGNFSLTDSPLGDYLPGLNTTATINQSFDLSGLVGASLVYFHHHALQWASGGDVCRVEVSTNGGGNWTAVRQHDFYLGDKGQFKRADVDLSDYFNQTIRIRLRFSSNSLNEDDGWFVDDFRLLAYLTDGEASTIFFDDFELGTAQWTLTGTWGLSLAGYVFSDLGDIDQDGVYLTTPVDNPVLIGEGMGFAAVRAAYTEGGTTWVAHTQVHHTAPQYKAADELGYDDLCPPFPRTCATTAAVAPADAPSRHVILEQNRPNPFNPSTDIRFLLPEPSRVSLRIYDESGRLARVLLDDLALPAGEHGLSWNGLDAGGQPAPSGVYFYELRVNGQEHIRRMVLLK